jgi:hypothetical protein
MKSIFKRALLAVPVVALYFTLGFHACLITSCSTDSTGHGGGGPKIVLSSGNPTDTKSFINLQTAGEIPAGSQLVLSCASRDCKIYLPNGSTDSTGHGGGTKMILVGTIPFTIPENTELVIRIIPKGDPARVDESGKSK